MYACANMVIQLSCFVRHQTCLVSKSDNKTVISPPCRRICERKDCYNLIKDGIGLYERLYRLCPDKLPHPGLIANASDCSNFPKKEINNVERCQLLPFTYAEMNYTEHCYEGNGESYNGTVNITMAGKTCLPWSINPFLSAPLYSNLQNNFCRNPQGYAKAPWCYVNEFSRLWEYCNVPTCFSVAADHNKMSLKITLVIVAGVLVLLLRRYLS
ncbi:plasminogen-like [Hydractinia symbiolongicarpus]|uniref:plasminogen-like n=1 Tax=Hydractinia symbiolongicarpus TaxID=13093 RepID=UPI00254E6995|nr:plasminogen-like [Hydractinia symbiolongicarpus]